MLSPLSSPAARPAVTLQTKQAHHGHHGIVASPRGRLHVCAAIKRGSDKTVICSKTVVARKGSEESVQALCQEVMDFSRGEMTDRANGILEFGVNHDMEDKNVFHFFERYSSNAKLGEHNVKPEVKAFMEKLQEHVDEPVGMALYEMKGGKLSNIMMQGGPKGEGGLDDATGAGGSGGGASLKQSSATVDLGKQDRGDGDTAWGMKAPAWIKKVLGKK